MSPDWEISGDLGVTPLEGQGLWREGTPKHMRLSYAELVHQGHDCLLRMALVLQGLRLLLHQLSDPFTWRCQGPFSCQAVPWSHTPFQGRVYSPCSKGAISSRGTELCHLEISCNSRWCLYVTWRWVSPMTRFWSPIFSWWPWLHCPLLYFLSLLCSPLLWAQTRSQSLILIQCYSLQGHWEVGGRCAQLSHWGDLWSWTAADMTCPLFPCKADKPLALRGGLWCHLIAKLLRRWQQQENPFPYKSKACRPRPQLYIPEDLQQLQRIALCLQRGGEEMPK